MSRISDPARNPGQADPKRASELQTLRGRVRCVCGRFVGLVWFGRDVQFVDQIPFETPDGRTALLLHRCPGSGARKVSGPGPGARPPA